jgi:hypothetical protein
MELRSSAASTVDNPAGRSLTTFAPFASLLGQNGLAQIINAANAPVALDPFPKSVTRFSGENGSIFQS